MVISVSEVPARDGDVVLDHGGRHACFVFLHGAAWQMHFVSTIEFLSTELCLIPTSVYECLYFMCWIFYRFRD